MSTATKFKVLTLSAVIAAACAAASANELDASMEAADVMRLNQTGGKSVMPKEYAQFADSSGGAVDFEVKMIRSGSLSEIADKPIFSLIRQPSFQLHYQVDKDSQTSSHRIGPPSDDDIDQASSMTAGSLIDNAEASAASSNGSYRLFEVSMLVNDARYWYEAFQLCRSTCLIADFVIPSLEADVSQTGALYELDTSSESKTGQTQLKWILNSTATGQRRSSRTWTSPYREVKVGRVLNRSTIKVGETEITLTCDTSGKITASYDAAVSSFRPGSGSGYQGDCNKIEADGTTFNGGKSIKVATMTGCAYSSLSSVEVDDEVSGTDDGFNADLKVRYSSNLGDKGFEENGRLLKDTCVFAQVP